MVKAVGSGLESQPSHIFFEYKIEKEFDENQRGVIEFLLQEVEIS